MALSNFLVSAQFTLCKPCFVQISQFHETEAHSKSYRTWILESKSHDTDWSKLVLESVQNEDLVPRLGPMWSWNQSRMRIWFQD